MNDHRNQTALPFRRILDTWWPLAASWLLMAMELPVVSAAVARLPDPQVNLAAWGGVVFPVSLIIESPIIMMLAASTALSRSCDSYQQLRRYMMWAGGILTSLHVLMAFTPLYDYVVVTLIGPPTEVVEPARIGLRLMTPWTWSIAYRRFNQGVLIRFGHSEAVGVGTVVRLSADALVLLGGVFLGTIPGTVVAGFAVASGVVAEAVYSGFRVRPVLREQVAAEPEQEQPMTLPWFLDFYVPLAMTSLLVLLIQPLGSAAMSRMPQALISLAAWPVVSGLVFMLRGLGMAFNEVVVALIEEPGSMASLRRFALLLASMVTVLLFLVAATPLSTLWFQVVSALPPDLAQYARRALWFALPLPGLTVFQSWFQGLILDSRSTRAITEAVALSLLTSSLILVGGILWGQVPGLYVSWAAFSLGTLVQDGWLYLRSRARLRVLARRDREAELVPLSR